ncbi:MAG: ThiF family adenylyltransferase [Pirellulales bacterium]
MPLTADLPSHVELIIARRTWDATLRQLLFRDSSFAVGTLRRQGDATSCELLVDQLTVEETPNGQRLPPLADWCAVIHDTSQTTAAQWIGKLSPRRSQVLAVLVVRAAAGQPASCEGLVYDQGRIIRLDGVCIIGGGMLQLVSPSQSAHEPNPPAQLPSAMEGESRWSRTAGGLGSEVWHKVRRARVTIVGAGRNGALMAWELAGLGVAQLRLIDGDQLAEPNLDAMIGLHSESVGSSKVEALAKRLIEFRPDLAITALAKSALSPEAQELLRRRSDLLITCVDSDVPRVAMGRVARETITAHLDVGTSVQRRRGELEISGDARLLLPGQGCVACVGGVANLDDVLYELAAPPGALRRAPPQTWTEQRAGSLVSINSVTVGCAVQMWLDLLAGRLDASYWQRLAWRPGQGLQSDSAPVDAAANCVFCRDSSQASDRDGARR